MASSSSTRNCDEYYCHTCETSVLVGFNQEADELQCTCCNLPFIEYKGQGIEAFLEPEIAFSQDSSNNNQNVNINNSNNANNQNNSSNVSNILNTILGTANSPHTLESSGSGVSPMVSIISNTGNRTIIRQIPLASRTGMGSGLGSLLGSINTLYGFSSGSTEESLPVGDLSNINDILHQILLQAQSSGSQQKPITPEALAHYTVTSILDSDAIMNMSCKDGDVENINIIENNTNGNNSHTENDMEEIGYCPITHESFEINDKILTLLCCHSQFKYDSIMEWLNQYNTCPICRKELVM